MTTEGLAWTWVGSTEPCELKLVTQRFAAPQEGEVLIANHAIALNPVDWKCLGWSHSAWSAGHVPGVDGAGTVVATGAGVTLPVGIRVAYHQNIARDGSFATHALIDTRAALPIPDALSDSVAAAFPCPGLTALQAIEKLPQVANRDVLITGGGGSVAFLCIQLAVRRGFRVWTTASPKHHARLLEVGVAGVFDYRDSAWPQALQHALGARRLFAAIDTVSAEHAASLASMVGYNGHMVCIQDRLASPAMPAFTTALSQHEVALNSIHTHGTTEDWRLLQSEGASMLKQLSIATLKMVDVQAFEFRALATVLQDLKDGKEQGKLIAAVPQF